MKKSFKVTEENIVDFFCLYSPQAGEKFFVQGAFLSASDIIDKAREHGFRVCFNWMKDVFYVIGKV